MLDYFICKQIKPKKRYPLISKSATGSSNRLIQIELQYKDLQQQI